MSVNKIKAIALCRVSTMGQMLDGNLEPQEERIVKAEKILNVEIVKWWKLAISSRKGKNAKRKDLREMLEYCKRYKSVRYLIVDEVDRFMRSINEYYWWKMEFQNAGVRLILANRPDIDPDDDRAVFDELIDVYRAEQSNNERIHKTAPKMMAKIRAGYYPSNPHTGYKKTAVKGFHEPDEPNWSAMKNAFIGMIEGRLDVTSGLKEATLLGLRTKNYGPKSVGGKPIDMYRWKNLMKDPYYCGVVKMSDWPEINENGLHEKMITPEQHKILVALANNRGKKFIVNRNNPLVPLSNEMECYDCLQAKKTYPRLVGYRHNNGKNRKSGETRFYYRYRCRSCSHGIRQEELHKELSMRLESLILTDEQREKLKVHFKKVWFQHIKNLNEKALIAEGHLTNLKTKMSDLIMSLAQNPDLKNDIRIEIDKLKEQINEAEQKANESKEFEKDLIEFTTFALDYVDNWKKQWWLLDKDTMRKCKQILFPAGFSLTHDKKVYTPETSLVYSFGTTKKAPEDANFTGLEGPVGLEPTTPCLKGRCSNRLSYGPLIGQKTDIFSLT